MLEDRSSDVINHAEISSNANRLTQADVARAMNLSQSVVAEIESARADVRYSTLDRYVEAVTGNRKRLDLTPA